MNNTKETNINIRIMNLRLERGCTREQLAELAGISPKFLYEIETNKKGFSARTLKGLADALGVSTDYILTGNENTRYDETIAAAIEKFEPSILYRAEALLKIACELAQSVT